MYSSANFDHPPAAVQALREAARGAILWLLWLLPPVLGAVAARGGMAWELVSFLGLALAIATTLGSLRRLSGRRGRLLLGLGLAGATVLLLGAGRGTLPYSASIALPFVILVLVGALGDGRALLAALGVLMLECLLSLGGSADPVLPPVQAGGLALLALVLMVAQRLWRRAARGRERLTLLVPLKVGSGAAPRMLSPPMPASLPPAFLVQAERTPDGTLRLVIAGREAGRLRVTVA